ncbi:RelA/SpoT family protein [Xylanibacter rodentium]|jgi:GTP pyrophosphokinase|uniref:Bifunctional (P)ppGpp synthetase/guanosine-3',5'-bis(Diphosphate) 3'-pyrophosphohydrolase n=3 Tax=Xylanibacter rodentium TaxID=2736289 RepID=A0ABX2ASK4_9BACT|nr:RelA/SpoT family protein [Xylanibacter rodentium]NPE11347.1 bifunctional (p)ppGpp synthetase/guanosine-3',5'-bis(diphosphate) 3'-pyrophosphohydrolase [Prevotella sp. PJ1A]NPE13615.1 bifunctional (p)ppGpp synthetase/guanosine-3',5'-bis(diphosphate) 3'-pyrophosphohydrolase [Xylanibacter rodentium]NPE38339.1 bifunctional (p)ppGpp synthetase/guanosine-3',5'-bis(diphosphate) 3'-pyrophosphohydrolase [Prevotella sp. PCJ2]
MNDDQIKREADDAKLIDDAFQHLIDTYMASRHRKKVDVITKAFNFARQAHKGVRRLSGEPYILHPIAVAQIACEEVGLGSTSICAALLHDVVEDTDYTTEDIENIFGAKVAQIVDGLTKISGGIFGDKASAQAENFKKLLLTMSDDIRVILIKICDRLHNMRTLQSQPANKQYKIAGETLYIYAPLANRLGLNKIKTELENLSFCYEHPEQYAAIQKKLESTQASRHILFDSFTAPIEKAMKEMGIKYVIKERVKSPYSIWHKMQTKHVTFDEIYDILAVRIIFTPQNREDEINECFKIYVAISKIYQSHPDRLRDWINHPKANGYQALHVTLMSKQGRWIEVQIRSDKMDEVAEQGFAAHWKYKEDGNIEMSEDDGELNDWLHTIKEILDDPQPNAMDFLDAIKLNLFASEIFVFTPKGEIKTMPAGCTALDFAFSIHTFLGSHCIGAKVNHKLVPLSHKLQSGDQVEILTSKSQHVQPSWINFASTAKAKAKIEAILRRDSRETQKRGEETLCAFLEKNDIQYTNTTADQLAAIHNIPKRESFLQALGERTILLGDSDLNVLKGKKAKSQKSKGWRKYVPFIKSDKDKNNEQQQMSLFVVPEKFNRKKPIFITDDNIGQYKFMHCCHPIPGDDILGFIDTKKQIEIHKRSCPVAAKLKTSFGNHILDAKWDMHRKLYFDATIHIEGIDRIGLLNEVTRIISEQMNINMHKVVLSCEEGIFKGTLEVRIHDKDDVKAIIESLKKVDNLQKVTQIM